MELLAVELASGFGNVVIGAAELNVNGLVELSVQEILRTDLTYTGAVRAFPIAPRPTRPAPVSTIFTGGVSLFAIQVSGR